MNTIGICIPYTATMALLKHGSCSFEAVLALEDGDTFMAFVGH